MGIEIRFVVIPSLSKLGDGYQTTCLTLLLNFLYMFEIL